METGVDKRTIVYASPLFSAHDALIHVIGSMHGRKLTSHCFLVSGVKVLAFDVSRPMKCEQTDIAVSTHSCLCQPMQATYAMCKPHEHAHAHGMPHGIPLHMPHKVFINACQYIAPKGGPHRTSVHNISWCKQCFQSKLHKVFVQSLSGER